MNTDKTGPGGGSKNVSQGLLGDVYRRVQGKIPATEITEEIQEIEPQKASSYTAENSEIQPLVCFYEGKQDVYQEYSQVSTQ